MAEGARMFANEPDPLHRAIGEGDLDAVRTLLRGGADPHSPDKIGRQPFSVTGDPEVVALLLAHGADPNRPDGATGYTPLDCAVRSEIPDVVIEMLVAAGADPNRIGPRGGSAFTYACRQADADVIRVLVRCGADVNRADGRGETPLQAAARRPDVRAILEAAGARA